MVRGRKRTLKIDTFVGTLMGILRFLESLEPPGGKSKVLGRFVTFLMLENLKKNDGFGGGMGGFGLI